MRDEILIENRRQVNVCKEVRSPVSIKYTSTCLGRRRRRNETSFRTFGMPFFTSLFLRFFIVSTHNDICINLCTICFITTVLCMLPTRYSPEFSMIIKIKSNYFSINHFDFAGVSRIFCYLRLDFLNITSANFSVAYIPLKLEII